MRYLLLFLLTLLIGCATPEPSPVIELPGAAPKSSISASLNGKTFRLGETSQQTLFVQLDDPDKVIDEAVVFLNVLYILPDDSGRYVRALDVFKNPNIDPDIFKKVLSGEELRAGIETQLTYTVDEKARSGLYDLNIQIFNGSETNPSRVNFENRIGNKNIYFNVVSE